MCCRVRCRCDSRVTRLFITSANSNTTTLHHYTTPTLHHYTSIALLQAITALQDTLVQYKITLRRQVWDTQGCHPSSSPSTGCRSCMDHGAHGSQQTVFSGTRSMRSMILFTIKSSCRGAHGTWIKTDCVLRNTVHEVHDVVCHERGGGVLCY